MVQESPLISVVTPVYNGESYISECIESVISQTYHNWEYVIVDNCSTDRTFEIASAYVESDSRIRIHTNDTFLELLPNWNYALKQVSPDSKYCKVVHADDKLLPECLRLMLDIAERNPSVGIVGAYRIDGNKVNLDDVPYPIQVLPGREICRRRLLGGVDVFGSPTSILIRGDLIRNREKFYNEQNIHADTEACFDLLRNVDFGFVHQVLTFTRRHSETQTSNTKRFATHKINHFMIRVKYGRYYLEEDEFNLLVKIARKNYYRALANHILRLNKIDFLLNAKDIFEFHKNKLTEFGQHISLFRLLYSMFVILYNKSLQILQVK